VNINTERILARTGQDMGWARAFDRKSIRRMVLRDLREIWLTLRLFFREQLDVWLNFLAQIDGKARSLISSRRSREHGRLRIDDRLPHSRPLALRNSRTESAPTSTACAAGVVAGPATMTGFNNAMPANLPSPRVPRHRKKPTAGAGDSASSLPPPILGRLA